MVKNRTGTQDIIMKRAGSGLEIPLPPFSGMGLKVYDPTDRPFIAIDFDRHVVEYDFGDED